MGLSARWLSVTHHLDSRHQPFFFYSTQESPPKPWAESTGAFAPQQIASNHQGLSDRKKVFWQLSTSSFPWHHGHILTNPNISWFGRSTHYPILRDRLPWYRIRVGTHSMAGRASHRSMAHHGTVWTPTKCLHTQRVVDHHVDDYCLYQSLSTIEQSDALIESFVSCGW